MARASILLVLVLVLVLVLAACGSSSHRAAARSCTDARAAPDMARLRADVAAIRVAARRPAKDRLKGNGEERKTEVILAAAGLGANEIAPLVGKHYGAVAKTIDLDAATIAEIQAPAAAAN